MDAKLSGIGRDTLEPNCWGTELGQESHRYGSRGQCYFPQPVADDVEVGPRESSGDGDERVFGRCVCLVSETNRAGSGMNRPLR